MRKNDFQDVRCSGRVLGPGDPTRGQCCCGRSLVGPRKTVQSGQPLIALFSKPQVTPTRTTTVPSTPATNRKRTATVPMVPQSWLAPHNLSKYSPQIPRKNASQRCALQRACPEAKGLTLSLCCCDRSLVGPTRKPVRPDQPIASSFTQAAGTSDQQQVEQNNGSQRKGDRHYGDRDSTYGSKELGCPAQLVQRSHLNPSSQGQLLASAFFLLA